MFADRRTALFALALLAPLAGCSAADTGATATAPASTARLSVASSNGRHDFTVELARTAAEQEKGLMFRTTIADNGGMLFAPYPPDGGPPREASFWMKNTPSPLDIIFVRADGTIARIAENTTPQSERPIPSGEPVAAILEIRGGRALELGIAEGDKVTWTGHGQ